MCPSASRILRWTVPRMATRTIARSSLPGYVLVITAFNPPYGWLAVAGGIVAAAWSSRYLFWRQESAMRATAMALVALYVVAVLYSLLFVQSQITRI